MDNNFELMQYTVDVLSDLKNDDKLKVFAIATKDGKILCDSHNEDDSKSWAENILSKLQSKKIRDIDNLFVTINTINSDNEFDLNILINNIHIENIYFGLPDPKLEDYLVDDPIFNFNNIYRYPDGLKRQIYNLNSNHYCNSNQNLKYNVFYYKNRINDIFLKEISKKGFSLTKDEIKPLNSIKKLSLYLYNKYDISINKAVQIIENAISVAFEKKYSSYDYSNDIRSLNPDWYKNINNIYNYPLDSIKIINVGVGSGNEASKLFCNCKNITCVDIADKCLKNVKKIIPTARILKCRAEELSAIGDTNFDLYISLRTYNSTFFNTYDAIKEASKVLKDNGVAIISIANGFLSEKGEIINGLIIPGINFIDIYRGFEFVKKISKELRKTNFKNINIVKTKEEIYIIAQLNRKKDVVVK